MSNSRWGDPKSLGGNRRRSSSESEANDFAANSMSPNGPLGGLNFPSGLKLTQGGSHPNLSSSDMGFISTPITEGANTRLGLGDLLVMSTTRLWKNSRISKHRLISGCSS